MKYFPLIWAALWRKPPRTVLTLLSVVVAFLLFGLLQAVNVAFHSGVEVSGDDRLIAGGKYSFTQMLPQSYQQRIRSIEGVDAVSHASWFGGVYQKESNFFPQFAVDGESYLDVYADYIVDPKARQAFLSTRTGALVGRGLAERFGWKIGDKIPLQATIWPKLDGTNTWTLDLVGFIDAQDEATRQQTQFLMFHYEHFNEARQFGRDLIGWYVVKVRNPAEQDRVAEAIDRAFANSPAETRTDSEKAFNKAFLQQMGDIQLIIRSILAAVFFTLLFLTGNTMMQSVRDRIPELAVLKTIGFTDTAVLLLVLAESFALCAVAALLGLGAAAVLMPALAARMPGLAMQPEVLLYGLAVAGALAVVVGILPALRAMRLNIVNALAGH